nr:Bifunctional UDP-N-acetylglucosamine transferase and deubiquitinase [Ipomoea batatas]
MHGKYCKTRKAKRRKGQSPTTFVNDISNMEAGGKRANSACTVAAAVDGGLVILANDAIHSFLAASTHDTILSQDLRDLASLLSQRACVPYRALRSIWIGSNPSERPELTSLLCGSGFAFSSPEPRKKSEELKARLRKLAEASERKAYEELVKDITPKKRVEEPFSSYKHQLGLSSHVVLMMSAGFLVGYAAFRALFSHSPAMSAAGGILGLVIGMLVETLLFIVRSTSLDQRSTSFVSKAKKSQ